MAVRERKPSKPRRGKRTKDGGATIKVTPATASVLHGEADLSDWDDEELLRGKRRNRHGGFTGRPPQVVPRELHRELTRRRFSRAHDILAESLVDGAKMLRSIINDRHASPSDRIRAAEVMFDRVLGKPKESVALDLSTGPEEMKPWQRMLATAIVSTDAQAAEQEIVEGEIADEPPAKPKQKSKGEIADEPPAKPKQKSKRAKQKRIRSKRDTG